MDKLDSFNVILLGIIYDPEKKKILLSKRTDVDFIENISWTFPGGRLNHGEDMVDALKKRIKEKTNIDVENLGSVFSKVYPEKEDLVSIYFLCEATSEEEKAGEKISELKWVSPEEVEEHFTTSFHPDLKEYILNLK